MFGNDLSRTFEHIRHLSLPKTLSDSKAVDSLDKIFGRDNERDYSNRYRRGGFGKDALRPGPRLGPGILAGLSHWEVFLAEMHRAVP
jgi:hypothetical protein